MAATKISIAGNNLTQLNTTLNDNGELVLSGKTAGNRNFSQTLALQPPCVVLWSPTTENFVALPISGEVVENMQYIDLVVSVGPSATVIG